MAKVESDTIAAVRESRPIRDPKLEALRQFAANITRKRGVVSEADVSAFKSTGHDNARCSIRRFRLALSLRAWGRISARDVAPPWGRCRCSLVWARSWGRFSARGSKAGPIRGRPSFYAYVIAGIASVAVVAAVVIPLEFTDAGRGPSVLGDAERPTASIWTRNLILSAFSFGLVGFSLFSYSALYASYAHTALGFSVIDFGAALGMYGIGAMLGVVGG